MMGSARESLHWARAHPIRASMFSSAVIASCYTYQWLIVAEGQVGGADPDAHYEYKTPKDPWWFLHGFGEKTPENDDPEWRKDQRNKEGTVMLNATNADERDFYWQVRNNERNWSIMHRDMQRQKDSYVYRHARSQDDDYGRQVTKYN